MIRVREVNSLRAAYNRRKLASSVFLSSPSDSTTNGCERRSLIMGGGEAGIALDELIDDDVGSCFTFVDFADDRCVSQNHSCGGLAGDDEFFLSEEGPSATVPSVSGDGALHGGHACVGKGKEIDEEDAEEEDNDYQKAIIAESKEEVIHEVDIEDNNDVHEDNEEVDDEKEEYKEFEEVGGNALGVVGFPCTIENIPNFGPDKQRSRMYHSLIKSYRLSENDNDAFKAMKNEILSYLPGAYTVDRHELKSHEREIPEVTTLLLVGLRGSGKSTLVNNILRVFENEDRLKRDASVSYNSGGYGTLFLQGYFIHQEFPSLCIYDSRSLSIDINENLENIRGWMTKGISNAEPVFRASDNSNISMAIQCKGRQMDHTFNRRRAVNFVIFVVNGLSVIKAMRSGKLYLDKLAENFNCPYLSFRDDKPLLVVTHGDLLEVPERVSVRMHLGELLGVSPLNIYDIPDSWDRATRLSIVNMLMDALRRAESNLPIKRRKPICKNWFADRAIHKNKGFEAVLLFLELLCFVLIFYYLSAFFHHDQKPDWHKIRHLWLA